MKRVLLMGLTFGALVPAHGFSLFYAGGKPARWDFSYAGNDAGNFNNTNSYRRRANGTLPDVLFCRVNCAAHDVTTYGDDQVKRREFIIARADEVIE